VRLIAVPQRFVDSVPPVRCAHGTPFSPAVAGLNRRGFDKLTASGAPTNDAAIAERGPVASFPRWPALGWRRERRARLALPMGCGQGGSVDLLQFCCFSIVTSLLDNRTKVFRAILLRGGRPRAYRSERVLGWLARALRHGLRALSRRFHLRAIATFRIVGRPRGKGQTPRCQTTIQGVFFHVRHCHLMRSTLSTL
jgi:hypothetical protein